MGDGKNNGAIMMCDCVCVNHATRARGRVDIYGTKDNINILLNIFIIFYSTILSHLSFIIFNNSHINPSCAIPMAQVG